MISVIIPTYNRAFCIERAVQSVLEQSTPPGEILIVDDGSTDNTKAIITRLQNSSAIPVVYFHQPNQGAASARNKGIVKSHFDMVAFLDSDDWWHKNKLAIQYDAMQRKDAAMISHTREIWFRHGKRVNQKKKHDPPHGNIFVPSLRMCVVGMSTVMMHKSCFERFGYFDEQLPCCEDYDLWLRMSCAIPFQRIDEALTFKDGGHEDQLSAIHRMGMDTYRITALVNVIQGGQLSDEQHLNAVAELHRKCTIYGNGCIKHGRAEEGRTYLQLPERIKNQLH
ncbi:MAG: glycosyl transferase family A [Desulfobulbus propionicus]|nr:MAG: glycosyl transferase family A [Desulfobulbus propionicus]PIE60615.1 MAG: glycosyl transferase family A [Desulfobulbus propionicus]